MLKQQILSANENQGIAAQPESKLPIPTQHPVQVAPFMHLRKIEASPKASGIQKSSTMSEQVSSLADKMYSSLADDQEAFINTMTDNVNELDEVVERLEYKCFALEELLQSIKETGDKQQQIEEYMDNFIAKSLPVEAARMT